MFVFVHQNKLSHCVFYFYFFVHSIFSQQNPSIKTCSSIFSLKLTFHPNIPTILVPNFLSLNPNQHRSNFVHLLSFGSKTWRRAYRSRKPDCAFSSSHPTNHFLATSYTIIWNIFFFFFLQLWTLNNFIFNLRTLLLI